MEEKKVKLSTVIILLLLIVIIAGGIYIYQLKSKATKTSNNPNESQSTNVAEGIQNKPAEAESHSTGTSEKVELSDQEKFDKYMQTYKKNIEKIVSEKNVEESNNEDNLFKDEIYAYSTDIYSDITNAWIELDKSGNVSLITNKSSELYSKYGNKSKIAENIASIYMCQVGQDDNFDLVMLGFDGSVKSLYISQDSLLKGVNVKDINVKYAINVAPYNNGAGTYGIVDINGNIVTK